MGGEYRFLEVGRKLNSPLGFPHLGGEVRTLILTLFCVSSDPRPSNIRQIGNFRAPEAKFRFFLLYAH